jgi:hypothetical protein
MGIGTVLLRIKSRSTQVFDRAHLTPPPAPLPDGGRPSIFEAQPAEVELSLLNPAKQFDARNSDHRGSELLEAEHWTDAQLDVAVALFDQVVRVFR